MKIVASYSFEGCFRASVVTLCLMFRGCTPAPLDADWLEGAPARSDLPFSVFVRFDCHHEYTAQLGQSHYIPALLAASATE